MSVLLQLDQVVKSYPSGETEVRALNGISLTIHKGEFVAFLGPSGCGKSTLMNILGGLDTPTAGRYWVEGVDSSTLPPEALAALRRDTFGFIFQRYNLLATATAAENVEIPAVYAGVAKEIRHARARELLTRLGLAERINHRPNQLSGGQQQRVSIARALMNDAPVILADEPTGALDTHSGHEVLALLKQLHQDGRTILLITHDVNIAQHAHRIIRLRDGQVESDTATDRQPLQSQNNKINASIMTVPTEKTRLWPDIREILHMSMTALQANIFRTALTLLGVVIGVAAVVAMLAIGDGGKQQVLERIASMGTNLLVIRPGAPGVRVSGDVATLTVEDTEAIRTLPNVIEVSPERSKGMTMRYGNVDYNTTVRGVWPGYTQVRDWPLAQGSFFTKADLEGYAPVIVLGRTVVHNLFMDDPNPIGKYVLVSNIPFEVIGIMDTQGANAMGVDQDDVAFIPITTGFMRVFGKQYMSSVTVRVAEGSQWAATESEIKALLIQRHKQKDFQVRNTASIMEMAAETQNTLIVLLGSVAAISLLVGGIGVMNIMLVSVTERTREIGIRMATGARMQDILLQFNIEAIVVCGCGGVLGVILGWVTAWLVQYAGIRVAFYIWPPIFAFSCAFLTGCIFGYLPARKAARLDPVVALASE
jgi:macrolide transport system ATP-binding/permease protein